MSRNIFTSKYFIFRIHVIILFSFAHALTPRFPCFLAALPDRRHSTYCNASERLVVPQRPAVPRPAALPPPSGARNPRGALRLQCRSASAGGAAPGDAVAEGGCLKGAKWTDLLMIEDSFCGGK